jgi:peptidoglycan LD-endopeptidase CwlK
MNRHLERLEGLHPDLVRVVKRLLAVREDVVVLEGMRTLERQRKLLALKATTTLRSRHLTGHAVDLAPTIDGEIRWDWPLYNALAPVVKGAAMREGVSIEWGGDWKFADGPHWQLSWEKYPIEKPLNEGALIA